MDTIELLRWIFSHILTPAAVLGILAIIVVNVSRMVRKGFHEDSREGSQRLSAAILPFTLLLYVTVREHVPHDSWFELGELVRILPAWQLFFGSFCAGVAVAAQVFRREPEHRLLMRIVVLVQSTVACFIGYVFIGVASSIGIDVAMGVLAGFCGYSVFPNLNSARAGATQSEGDRPISAPTGTHVEVAAELATEHQ